MTPEIPNESSLNPAEQNLAEATEHHAAETTEQHEVVTPEHVPTDTPEQTAVPTSQRFKWMIAAVVLALLAIPVIRKVTSGNDATANTSDATAAGALNHSLAAYQAGRYQEAIDAAQICLKMDPNNARAYNNIGVSYLQMKQYEPAQQALVKAISLDPNFAMAKANLKWLLDEKAKASAPPPAPGTAGFFLNQSLIAFQSKDYQGSIDFAKKALELDPKSAAAYNNISISYSVLGKYDLGIENANKALAIDPNFQLAKNNLKLALDNKAKAQKK